MLRQYQYSAARAAMRDDPAFNIEFVKAVERFPVLYNYTLEEHSMKHETERAWDEIGRHFNERAGDCRDKWRILRGSYVRFMRQKADTTKKRKPYYLAAYMDFVLPYLKCRRTPRQFLDLSKAQYAPPFPLSDFKVEHAEDEGVYESPPHPEPYQQGESDAEEDAHSVQSPPLHPRLPALPFIAPYDSLLVDFFQRRRVEEESQPDLQFFKSLLPEMSRLDPQKKNRFKIQTIGLLNKLLYGEHSCE